MAPRKADHPMQSSPYGARDYYKSEEHEKQCSNLFEACRKGDLRNVSLHLTSDTVNQPDVSGRHATPLHFAAGFGHTACVQQLLSKGACVSRRDDGGFVPLHNACSFGHVDAVRVLLSNGADPNIGDNWGFTPLHEAAAWAKAEVCTTLLQHGASAYAENSDGKTPVQVADGEAKAVFSGDYRKEELLEAARNGDDSTLCEILTLFNVSCHADDGRKSTPLHLASGYNRVNIVKILLDKGADVHAKDKGGLVPLHNACCFGHAEVVALLLGAGADVNSEDLWKYSPLHEAANKGRFDVIALLIAKGADPLKKNANGKAPLDLILDGQSKQMILNELRGFQMYVASESGDIPALRKLLNRRDAHYKNPCNGESPLHAAARASYSKRTSVVEILLRKGCPIESKNNDGASALLVAAEAKNADVVEALLEAGAYSKAENRNGDTMLHIGATKGDLEICRLALVAGVFADSENSEGKTAAAMASTSAVRDLINLWAPSTSVDASLQPYGCTRNEQKKVSCNMEADKSQERLESVANGSVVSCQTVSETHAQAGSTGSARSQLELELLGAARSGDLEVVKRIVEHSPTSLINCRDLEGRQSTPLHFAAGYNRVEVLRYLLEKGADVRACDTGWLVPLHNACAYGHLTIASLLVKHGADVNATDKWRYTPLHEAALKGKFEICKLLLLHGADPNRKGRDGKTPLDVVKEGAEDVADLLRGDSAVLEAAKKGDTEKIKKILIPSTVNCRDALGRNSTPLHLAAGYNNFEVAQFLLENGAGVNAEDKGGLIPLHNASSYGHLEIAMLLIDYGADVNRPDRWRYTPLHEAAQKGRTQICSLLLNKGADVTLKNHEGHTAYEIAAAADTKELLMEALPRSFATMPNVCITSSTDSASTCRSASSSPVNGRPEADLSGSNVNSDSKRARELLSPEWEQALCEISMQQFLSSIGLENLSDLFQKEKITPDVLAAMSHDDLKAVGIDAFGIRFRLLKSIEKLLQELKRIGSHVNEPSSASGCSKAPFLETPTGFNGTVLVSLCATHPEFVAVRNDMNATLVTHRDGSGVCTSHTRFEVVDVQKVLNKKLFERYKRRREDIAEENQGEHNEQLLYHGSPFIHSIVQKGFDERLSYIGGMFGAGIYFAEHSSKSNQYVFEIGSNGCSSHRDRSCSLCVRHLLYCRVALGKSFIQTTSNKMAHSPPGHHSVVGQPCAGGLNYPEYVIYRGEQAYPEYVITYRVVNDKSNK